MDGLPSWKRCVRGNVAWDRVASMLLAMIKDTLASGVGMQDRFPPKTVDASLAEARALPLDDDALARFLGGTARRLLTRS